MGTKNWLGWVVGVLILVAIGIRVASKSSDPVAKKTLSQTIEGMGTPPPNPLASPPSSTDPVKATTQAANVKPQGSTLSPADQKKLSTFKEIIDSKNDNDPRIDTELDHLSPELKAALEKDYSATAPEKLNHRGTIVFLVGRSLDSVEDVQFLSQVLMEKPCLSLENCSKEVREEDPEQRHHDTMNQTTLNYPQLMGIREAIESYNRLKDDRNTSPQLLQAFVDLFNQAMHSPNQRVAIEAEKAMNSIKN